MIRSHQLIRGVLHQAKKRAVRLQNRFRRKALILVYHRVTRLPLDPWGLCVSPTHFDQQLAVLKSIATPVALRTIALARSEKDLPERAVALTFDDGYLDNYENALPLLEKHGVPATMFLTSGYFEGNRGYWWDELSAAILDDGDRPPELQLSIRGHQHRWHWHSGAGFGTANVNWRAWESPTARREEIYQQLYELLALLEHEERREVLQSLSEWAGKSTRVGNQYRSVTREEARLLSQSVQIEVGAHTVTHSVLSSLSPEQQGWEIATSKRELEAIVGNPITSFAYPYGKKFHYNEHTKRILQSSGFSCGCSNFWGATTVRTSRWELPRIQTPDWGSEQFAAGIEEWFRG